MYEINCSRLCGSIVKSTVMTQVWKVMPWLMQCKYSAGSGDWLLVLGRPGPSPAPAPPTPRSSRAPAAAPAPALRCCCWFVIFLPLPLDRLLLYAEMEEICITITCLFSCSCYLTTILHIKIFKCWLIAATSTSVYTDNILYKYGHRQPHTR